VKRLTEDEATELSEGKVNARMFNAWADGVPVKATKEHRALCRYMLSGLPPYRYPSALAAVGVVHRDGHYYTTGGDE
jgi:hypothetical protein